MFTLALLCRLLAEQQDLPRNFLLLPYMQLSNDSTNAAVFRQLILAEQNGDAIAAEIGSSRTIIQAGGAVFQNWFANHPDAWGRFFRPAGPNPQNVPSFRGFLSHDVNGHHPCPGPLFDWHRLSREVWDWWWYPFDLEPGGLSVSTTMRPYRQARGDTQLREYYYDANGTADDYNTFRQPLQLTERFLLPTLAPVFAMANGVVVAARFALSNALAPVSFILVRHEVFHAQSGNRIDYDVAPTYVWSLVSFLSHPGFTVETTSPVNPDWLNRFAVRLKECELAVEFHRTVISAGAAHAAHATLGHAWTHAQAGAGPRLATGAEIERDATEYRRIAGNLATGGFALFPLESEPAPTPVRVILGDYLGTPNRIPGDVDGIQVEIFSRDRLDGAVSTQRPVSAAAEDWWIAAAATTRHERSADADLPTDGNVWNYTLTNFLQWVNGVTWASEWPKYHVVDTSGVLAPLPQRPMTRIIV
jgi:hypothetical protein